MNGTPTDSAGGGEALPLTLDTETGFWRAVTHGVAVEFPDGSTGYWPEWDSIVRRLWRDDDIREYEIRSFEVGRCQTT